MVYTLHRLLYLNHVWFVKFGPDHLVWSELSLFLTGYFMGLDHPTGPGLGRYNLWGSDQ